MRQRETKKRMDRRSEEMDGIFKEPLNRRLATGISESWMIVQECMGLPMNVTAKE